MRKLFVLSRVMLSTLLVALLFSCNNDVKKVNIDNQIAVSLFSGNVKVGDLLNGENSFASDLLKISDDGTLYACYADSIIDIVNASDLLSGIKDITFTTSGEFELPEIPAIPNLPDILDSLDIPDVPDLPDILDSLDIPDVPELPDILDSLDIPDVPDLPDVPGILGRSSIDSVFVFEFKDFVSVPFEYDGYEIEFVELKNGRLSLTLSTDLTLMKNVVLTTDNIKLGDGSNLDVTLDFTQSQEQVVDLDLTNCVIAPVNKNITFSALVSLDVSLEHGMQGGKYGIDLKGGIYDVEFKTIDGSIQDTQFDFIGSHDFSFSLPNMQGDLNIPTPEFTLKYVNTFGFNAKCTLDSLFMTEADGDVTSLIKDWKQMKLELAPTTEEHGVISNLGDYLVDEIDLLSGFTKMTLNGKVVLGCESVGQNMITDDSHIDVIADITLPLEFKINSLTYLDTLDFNLTLNGDESAEEGENENPVTVVLDNIFDDLEFKFVFENAIPIQIKPQMYVMQQGALIDSLFDERPCVHGNFEGAKEQDIFVVHVTGEKLHNLQLADQLLLDINLSSLGKQVVINTNDAFDLRIGLKTKTSEIDLNDFNF